MDWFSGLSSSMLGYSIVYGVPFEIDSAICPIGALALWRIHHGLDQPDRRARHNCQAYTLPYGRV
jgi:hypothetical protein